MPSTFYRVPKTDQAGNCLILIQKVTWRNIFLTHCVFQEALHMKMISFWIPCIKSDCGNIAVLLWTWFFEFCFIQGPKSKMKLEMFKVRLYSNFYLLYLSLGFESKPTMFFKDTFYLSIFLIFWSCYGKLKLVVSKF